MMAAINVGAVEYGRPQGGMRRAAAGACGSRTIVAGSRINGLVPSVAKMRIEPRKDEMDVDANGNDEGTKEKRWKGARRGEKDIVLVDEVEIKSILTMTVRMIARSLRRLRSVASES
jgi:hypothetical protein